MRRALALAFATTLFAGFPAQAQQAPDAAEMRRQMDARNAIPDTPGDGPYPAVIEEYASLPDHVVYRPADLAPFFGGALPVVVWGNGGCADDGSSARLHLAQIASYGYLVVAPGPRRSGPGATHGPAPRQPRPADGLPPPATSVADVMAGIDWAIAQDADPASPLYGRVATDKLAVAGHSCGGLQAIQAAADPRIDTVLIHNSGIYNSEASPIQSMTVSKAMLRGFHQPVLYVLGGEGDIAHPNGMDDYARIDHVPIMLADLPVGHGGTFFEPFGGAAAQVAVDWLEWQLRGDAVAGRTFTGENCRLCAGSQWTLHRKGW